MSNLLSKLLYSSALPWKPDLLCKMEPKEEGHMMTSLFYPALKSRRTWGWVG